MVRNELDDDSNELDDELTAEFEEPVEGSELLVVESGKSKVRNRFDLSSGA